MRCVYHPAETTVAYCDQCAADLCQQCALKLEDGRILCHRCIVALSVKDVRVEAQREKLLREARRLGLFRRWRPTYIQIAVAVGVLLVVTMIALQFHWGKPVVHRPITLDPAYPMSMLGSVQTSLEHFALVNAGQYPISLYDLLEGFLTDTDQNRRVLRYLHYELDQNGKYLLRIKNTAPFQGRELVATPGGIRVLESGPPEVQEAVPEKTTSAEGQEAVRPQSQPAPAENTAELGRPQPTAPEVADKSPEKTTPPEDSLERFVEKWRLAWEQGDLAAYISCYHPEFKIRNMDFQSWKRYKQKLFKRETGRNVELRNIDISIEGATAVVVFKQKYRTGRHQDQGLKTLELRRHNGGWAIFRETWEPLPGQG